MVSKKAIGVIVIVLLIVGAAYYFNLIPGIPVVPLVPEEAVFEKHFNELKGVIEANDIAFARFQKAEIFKEEDDGTVAFDYPLTSFDKLSSDLISFKGRMELLPDSADKEALKSVSDLYLNVVAWNKEKKLLYEETLAFMDETGADFAVYCQNLDDLSLLTEKDFNLAMAAVNIELANESLVIDFADVESIELAVLDFNSDESLDLAFLLDDLTDAIYEECEVLEGVEE